MLQGLVQAHTRPALAQDVGQRGLAHLDRLPQKVRPVQLQEIESVDERLGLVPPVAKQLESGQPPFVTAHHLAIDQAGPDREVVHGLPDQELVEQTVGPALAPSSNVKKMTGTRSACFNFAVPQ